MIAVSKLHAYIAFKQPQCSSLQWCRWEPKRIIFPLHTVSLPTNCQESVRSKVAVLHSCRGYQLLVLQLLHCHDAQFNPCRTIDNLAWSFGSKHESTRNKKTRPTSSELWCRNCQGNAHCSNVQSVVMAFHQHDMAHQACTISCWQQFFQQRFHNSYTGELQRSQ